MSDRDQPTQIKFHYIKSHHFRTLRSDGVVGGLNPHLDIVMSFYSERQPIPTEIVQEIKPDMSLGVELDRKVREGIVREVEIAISMNFQVATAFRDWLSDRIREVEETRNKYELLRPTGEQAPKTH